MTTLLVLIPPRTLRARADGADGLGAATEFAWVRSDDAGRVLAQGAALPALLPRGDTVVAVLSAADVGWQRLELPRVAASRLRAALCGALEDTVLDEPEQLHFALEPGAAAGRPSWVAVVHRAGLVQLLSLLEQGGVQVDRIVPASSPGPSWRGHVEPSDAPWAEAAPVDLSGHRPSGRLCLSGPDGVAELPLEGSTARRVREIVDPTAVVWTAAPAVVEAAEHWLERAASPSSTGVPGERLRLTVQTPAEVAVQAAAGPWDLRQFDLALPRRGSRWFSQLWRHLRSPPWKPVRVGLAAMAVLQVVGLNAWAWQQERLIGDLRRAQSALLQTTHPQVRAVLDAPLQMQRETERLRSAAGVPGPDDLEAALAAASSAWPHGRQPASAVRFEPGRLTLSVAGWSAAEVQAFGERLRPSGWRAELGGDRLTLTRAPATPAAPPGRGRS